MKRKWNWLAMAGALLLGQIAYMGQAQAVSAGPMCTSGTTLVPCTVVNFQPKPKAPNGGHDWADSIKDILDSFNSGMGKKWLDETNHSIYTFKANGRLDSIASGLKTTELFKRSDFDPINIINAGSNISFTDPGNSKKGVITIGKILNKYKPEVGDFFYSAALKDALDWFNANKKNGATLTVAQKYSHGVTFAMYASANPLLGIVKVPVPPGGASPQ